MAPYFEKLAKDIPAVAFASADVDEAGELADQYGVSAVPHFVLLRGGEKVAEYVGSKPEDLEAMIRGAL